MLEINSDVEIPPATTVVAKAVLRVRTIEIPWKARYKVSDGTEKDDKEIWYGVSIYDSHITQDDYPYQPPAPSTASSF